MEDQCSWNNGDGSGRAQRAIVLATEIIPTGLASSASAQGACNVAGWACQDQSFFLIGQRCQPDALRTSPQRSWVNQSSPVGGGPPRRWPLATPETWSLVLSRRIRGPDQASKLCARYRWRNALLMLWDPRCTKWQEISQPATCNGPSPGRPCQRQTRNSAAAN